MGLVHSLTCLCLYILQHTVPADVIIVAIGTVVAVTLCLDLEGHMLVILHDLPIVICAWAWFSSSSSVGVILCSNADPHVY